VLPRYKNERSLRPCRRPGLTPRVTLSSPFLGMSAPHIVNVNSPRVTRITPFPEMSVPHLVDVDSPRVTVISPLPGMSSPHLVDVNSPRMTVISPFAGMSAPHLVDVYSPRVTLISPFSGMPASHLADVDCSLYYFKDDNMNLDPLEFAHVVLLCLRLHNTTLSVANSGPSPTFCCEARRVGRDTTPWCVSPCPHFNSVRNEPKLVSRAIRASIGISDFFGIKWQNPSLEGLLAPPEQPLAVKF
jgi:hypothetical protein